MIRRFGILTLVALAACGLATNGVGMAQNDGGSPAADGSVGADAPDEVDAGELDAAAEANADASPGDGSATDASVDGSDAAADAKLDAVADAPPDVVDAGVPGTITNPSSLGFPGDRVSKTDQGLTADGQNDGVVRVSVVGPINALMMVTSNNGGNTTGNSQWDTLVLTDIIPQTITTAHAVGSNTWIMGVYDSADARLNDANGRISIGPGTHTLTLYMGQNGNLTSGTTFRIYARVPGINGDTWTGGPVFTW